MVAPDVQMSQNPFKFRTLTCLIARSVIDPLLEEVKRDVESSSLLEAMKAYIQELRGNLDNNARPFQKLARLFAAGTTPERVEGHHDGVAVGLRTGDERGLLSSFGNFMGLLWGEAVGPVAPWVGKSFDTVDANIIQRYTEGAVQDDPPTYLGINHFNRLPDSTVNHFSISALTFWMHLKDAPAQEHDLYGHDRNGGLFIARKTRSVYAGTDREVFQLNYRWANLGNAPPFTYLIDELVNIADGAYLGQLLFATRKMLGTFDPAVPNAEYHYQHFGYFLLMDDTWSAETRRVFPHIEAGRITQQQSAISVVSQKPAVGQAAISGSKFTTLTLSGADGNCDDAVFADIQQELQRYDTILDLLKSYSNKLQESLDNRSPYFGKLLELFNRGQAPDEVRGYLRGALISFHSEGFYKLFNLNTLDFAWKLGKFFTPWTGKTFDDISQERLADLTDGIEKGAIPTFWGANTLSFRSAKQKFIKQMMKLVGVPCEEVPVSEAQKYGYDLKSFFFISHTARSVNDENKGKRVFQFNYRWPKLHTFPPDNFCIDELVMLAQGLYLGQLIYSTELLKKFDPKEDPAAYRYRVFGYFLLMDEDWNKRRLQIGLDPFDV